MATSSCKDDSYVAAEEAAYMLAEEMERGQLTNKEIREIFLAVHDSRLPTVRYNTLPEIEEPE